MGTLQKLKAYFGMVPADEYDGYDLDDLDEYDDRGEYRGAYRRAEYPVGEDEYDPYAERVGRRGPARYEDDRFEPEPVARADFPGRPAARPRPPWSADAPVQGALAMEPRREPPRPLPSPVPSPSQSTAAKPSAGGYPMGRIVTLHPASFTDARTIGEHYRDGTPVIMNLTELDDSDARRLVDFAAGLVFALRGSMDKVTNKVFLISPPNQDPTAEDKRRIAEGGFLNRS
ncbi:cell division protein SepF [Actinophytocola oryzae]|uniref:Cell division protein SepF n=1 Tax=Actinophytocola oryzae TaxID=502181 RepID=A0A4R7VBI9_9PSEU|nr:cell division protein SepF [Actinophytocola oryzae]TDV46298.1 cell division inhibitor SepF [Actinophytocola oryzae]